ncbi:MAG: sensor histidine kinase [Terriglobia bacterium]
MTLPLIIFALAVFLVVLAFLQIHWSNQVSQAERDRMTARLDMAVARFRRDFHLELLHVCWAFEIENTHFNSKALKAYADRYEDWQDASAHPELVAGIFAWKQSSGSPLFRLDPVSGKFLRVAWPPDLAEIRQLAGQGEQAPADGQETGWNRPWFLDETIPALIHRLGEETPAEGGADRIGPGGGLIIKLNMQSIQRVLFPMLADRYFRGPEGSAYRVSIVSGGNSARVIYQSFASPTGKAAFTGDVEVELIRDPIESLDRDRGAGGQAFGMDGSGDYAGPPSGRVQETAPLRHLRIYPAGRSTGWRLIARHRAGSVNAAVLGLRRRNLAVSLGVLLLLAASVALIIISAQRAQRLAQLQMNFVAGVSHELRTPLAVICSAAENLADGVVEAREQVKSYGALIRGEGRRLTEIVEHVLVFAAHQGGRQIYQRQPVHVAEVIEAALEGNRTAVKTSGATVERRIDPDLPPVVGDAAAVTRCLRNLISNAIKYGGANPKLSILARIEETETGPEVQIDVEDQGPGIQTQDVPHIFEPFYRGKAHEHVHGTGLGLSLAREIAEAMNGSLTVRSEPGQGSCFTLHLPAIPVPEQEKLARERMG